MLPVKLVTFEFTQTYGDSWYFFQDLAEVKLVLLNITYFKIYRKTKRKSSCLGLHCIIPVSLLTSFNRFWDNGLSSLWKYDSSQLMAVLGKRRIMNRLIQTSAGQLSKSSLSHNTQYDMIHFPKVLHKRLLISNNRTINKHIPMWENTRILYSSVFSSNTADHYHTYFLFSKLKSGLIVNRDFCCLIFLIMILTYFLYLFP